MYEQDGVFIHEQCGGEIRKLEKLPPQVEKVSGEKLYSLRGGMPEEWKKLKIEDALPLVEKQVGGALRRLQVQEDQPYYKACEKCQEDGSGDFSCFFRHATDEQKRGVLMFAAEEGWKEQEKMVQGAKLFARDFTETIEDLAKDDAPTPENDSWENEFDSKFVDEDRIAMVPGPRLQLVEIKTWIASHKDKWEREAYELGESQGHFRGMEEALAGDIKRYPLERDAVVRQEERTKLREVVEAARVYEVNVSMDSNVAANIHTIDKHDLLTALSEGEGR